MLMIVSNALAQLFHGTRIHREQPSTQWTRKVIEFRSRFVQCINRWGDQIPRIEHRVELGDPMSVPDQMGSDRVENELASSSRDEPIVRQRDVELLR